MVTTFITIFVFLLSTDVRAHGNWRLLDELDDPELWTLVCKLPPTILHSCADSTVMKYLCTFEGGRLWLASSKGLESISANPHLFALPISTTLE